MGLLNMRRYNNANSGCRPGCGCLIFILLALLIGYAMMNFFGGALPIITLPGGSKIEYPGSGSGGNQSDDGFDFERDSKGGNTIDYNNKLNKGLPDDKEKDMRSMDI